MTAHAAEGLADSYRDRRQDRYLNKVADVLQSATACPHATIDHASVPEGRAACHSRYCPDPNLAGDPVTDGHLPTTLCADPWAAGEAGVRRP